MTASSMDALALQLAVAHDTKIDRADHACNLKMKRRTRMQTTQTERCIGISLIKFANA
jgi:hypothetical protein